jgi:hypothetical protein
MTLVIICNMPFMCLVEWEINYILIHILIITDYKNKFWEELIAYFPSTWHRWHRKGCLWQFYSCTSIRCCSNILTELLPGNDRGIHVQTHRLMGGVYEVRHWDGLKCYNIHTKFYKYWFSHLKVNKKDTETAWWSHKPSFIFSKQESMLIRQCR